MEDTGELGRGRGVRRQVRAGSVVTMETKETDRAGVSRPFQDLPQHVYEDFQPLSDEKEKLQDGGRWTGGRGGRGDEKREAIFCGKVN